MLMQSHMYIILSGYLTINYFLTELLNYSMIKIGGAHYAAFHSDGHIII